MRIESRVTHSECKCIYSIISMFIYLFFFKYTACTIRYETTNIPLSLWIFNSHRNKSTVLFLHSPLASSYSIKISIKIFGSGNDGCGKLNIIEATGNRSQNLRNYLPREVRSSGLRFIGLLYYNTILLWYLTYSIYVYIYIYWCNI